MAANEIVNKWADDLRRNLDNELPGINVSARNMPKFPEKLGRITIGTPKFRIKIDLIKETNRVSIRIIDRSENGEVTKRSIQMIDAMGFTPHLVGEKVVSNVEFNRINIARLAAELAA